MSAEKRLLKLANAEEVAGEVRRLRAGYARAGNWTLPQICWHLNTIMTFTMSPGPHAPLEVDAAAKAKLAQVLATGQVSGVKAPERVVPPEDVGEEVIDQFLGTLQRLQTFKGPFAPHRLFGEVPFDDYVRLHLIHASHHLGHLIPKDA
ncbi:MAG TPA: DUF1569 domain-containing protein [Phycisphaerae bacterium]|jgi:hypothetical protein|nr:DUF1569 domain-containing protein [Phycisphaerae bacterium]